MTPFLRFLRRRGAVAVLLVALGAVLASRGVGGPPRGAPPLDPLDVNAAPEAELSLLPGVGPSLAGAIAADRRARGPFRSVADLDRVRGIGPSTLARLAPSVRAGVRVPAPAYAAP